MVYDDICLWITHTQQDAWPCMVTTRNCLNSSFYRQYYTSIQETDALMLTTIIGACTLSFFVDPNEWWNFRCSFTNSGARASTCKIRSTPSFNKCWSQQLKCGATHVCCYYQRFQPTTHSCVHDRHVNLVDCIFLTALPSNTKWMPSLQDKVCLFSSSLWFSFLIDSFLFFLSFLFFSFLFFAFLVNDAHVHDNGLQCP